MKDIKQVYPSSFEEWFSGISDYGPLIESFEYEVLLQVDDDDYQGDTRLLFKNGSKIGYLNFGWGSCSGCDALQACSSYDEVDELRSHLYESIKWETKSDMLKYFETHDWEGDYSWHQEEKKRFISEAIGILRKP